jgi:hypothetical protein
MGNVERLADRFYDAGPWLCGWHVDHGLDAAQNNRLQRHAS